MKLLTEELHERLLRNGCLRRHLAEEGLEGLVDCDLDFLPVVKLFTPEAACTWLLTEIDPDDEDRAFGLCDLGLGFPELGYVSLAELASVSDALGVRIECDLHFCPEKKIWAYADEACSAV